MEAAAGMSVWLGTPSNPDAVLSQLGL